MKLMKNTINISSELEWKKLKSQNNNGLMSLNKEIVSNKKINNIYNKFRK